MRRRRPAFPAGAVFTYS